MISGIVAWLVSGMKQLVCAIIYWVIWWIWPWFDSAMGLLPSAVATAPAAILDGTSDLLRMANVFFPVEEGIPILLGYWGFLLVFRIFHVVDQVKSI